jgi:Ribosomal protein L7/L12 C-terminal domain
VSEIDYGARARLDYIEKQLQALFPDSYVPFDRSDATGMPAAVVELARAGNLIAAIKEYRQITGAGLAEAKKAVEAIR